MAMDIPPKPSADDADEAGLDGPPKEPKKGRMSDVWRRKQLIHEFQRKSYSIGVGASHKESTEDTSEEKEESVRVRRGGHSRTFASMVSRKLLLTERALTPELVAWTTPTTTVATLRLPLPSSVLSVSPSSSATEKTSADADSSTASLVDSSDDEATVASLSTASLSVSRSSGTTSVCHSDAIRPRLAGARLSLVDGSGLV